MLPTLTPQQSAAKWHHATRKEGSAAPCLAKPGMREEGEGELVEWLREGWRRKEDYEALCYLS
jgi:hypothetical protein